jgi:3-deoxy-D-manno-octulosonic-acid transferase
MLILDLLYIILLIISFPFWIHYLFKSDYRKHFRMRIIPRFKGNGEKSVWIHAVSVGEVKSLKGLIRNLVQAQNKNVILSVGTPSGFAFAVKELEGVMVIPAPFDASFIIRRFITVIRPEIVIFNELELWPNWLLLLHRQQVPIVLINGRISERAFSWYSFFSFFIGRFISRIDLLVVQSELYQDRFLRLKIAREKIVICGNIKADEAYNNLQNLPRKEEILARLRLNPTGKKILTLASSHPADEKILIEALGRLPEDFIVILVPRHPGRSGKIGRQFEKRAIPYQVFSRPQPAITESKVMIFDEIGYLFPILSISEIVMMGGTYQRKIGGHDLYEPAVLGKVVVGGRFYQNFSDIGQALLQNGAYRQVDTASELIDFLSQLDSIDTVRAGKDACQEVLNRRGSVPCALRYIQKFLNR